MKPFEIVMSPFEVWLSASEAWPDLDETPSGAWAKLGTNGKYNLAEDGVTVAHEQSISTHRTLGSTGPVKAARTEEDLRISLILEDMTAEEYGKVLNNVTAVDVPAESGVPGHREITLRQGPDVSEFKMLIKGPSAYGDAWAAQYQIPRVIQFGNPSPVFNKGDAVGLACEFLALEDPDAATEAERFGKLLVQDATALA